MGVTYDTSALVAAAAESAASGPATAPCSTAAKSPSCPPRPGPGLARRQPPGPAIPPPGRRDTEALDDTRARATGALAARSATSDIVDAYVVEGALRRHDLIISSDPGDLQAIAAAISRHLESTTPDRHSPGWPGLPDHRNRPAPAPPARTTPWTTVLRAQRPLRARAYLMNGSVTVHSVALLTLSHFRGDGVSGYATIC